MSNQFQGFQDNSSTRKTNYHYVQQNQNDFNSKNLNYGQNSMDRGNYYGSNQNFGTGGGGILPGQGGNNNNSNSNQLGNQRSPSLNFDQKIQQQKYGEELQKQIKEKEIRNQQQQDEIKRGAIGSPAVSTPNIPKNPLPPSNTRGPNINPGYNDLQGGYNSYSQQQQIQHSLTPSNPNYPSQHKDYYNNESPNYPMQQPTGEAYDDGYYNGGRNSYNIQGDPQQDIKQLQRENYADQVFRELMKKNQGETTEISRPNSNQIPVRPSNNLASPKNSISNPKVNYAHRTSDDIDQDYDLQFKKQKEQMEYANFLKNQMENQKNKDTVSNDDQKNQLQMKMEKEEPLIQLGRGGCGAPLQGQDGSLNQIRQQQTQSYQDQYDINSVPSQPTQNNYYQGNPSRAPLPNHPQANNYDDYNNNYYQYPDNQSQSTNSTHYNNYPPPQFLSSGPNQYRQPPPTNPISSNNQTPNYPPQYSQSNQRSNYPPSNHYPQPYEDIYEGYHPHPSDHYGRQNNGGDQYGNQHPPPTSQGQSVPLVPFSSKNQNNYYPDSNNSDYDERNYNPNEMPNRGYSGSNPYLPHHPSYPPNRAPPPNQYYNNPQSLNNERPKLVRQGSINSNYDFQDVNNPNNVNPNLGLPNPNIKIGNKLKNENDDPNQLMKRQMIKNQQKQQLLEQIEQKQKQKQMEQQKRKQQEYDEEQRLRKEREVLQQQAQKDADAKKKQQQRQQELKEQTLAANNPPPKKAQRIVDFPEPVDTKIKTVIPPQSPPIHKLRKQNNQNEQYQAESDKTGAYQNQSDNQETHYNSNKNQMPQRREENEEIIEYNISNQDTRMANQKQFGSKASAPSPGYGYNDNEDQQYQNNNYNQINSNKMSNQNTYINPHDEVKIVTKESKKHQMHEHGERVNHDDPDQNEFYQGHEHNHEDNEFVDDYRDYPPQSRNVNQNQNNRQPHPDSQDQFNQQKFNQAPPPQYDYDPKEKNQFQNQFNNQEEEEQEVDYERDEYSESHEIILDDAKFHQQNLQVQEEIIDEDYRDDFEAPQEQDQPYYNQHEQYQGEETKSIEVAQENFNDRFRDQRPKYNPYGNQQHFREQQSKLNDQSSLEQRFLVNRSQAIALSEISQNFIQNEKLKEGIKLENIQSETLHNFYRQKNLHEIEEKQNPQKQQSNNSSSKQQSSTRGPKSNDSDEFGDTVNSQSDNDEDNYQQHQYNNNNQNNYNTGNNSRNQPLNQYNDNQDQEDSDDVDAQSEDYEKTEKSINFPTETTCKSSVMPQLEQIRQALKQQQSLQAEIQQFQKQAYGYDAEDKLEKAEKEFHQMKQLIKKNQVQDDSSSEDLARMLDPRYLNQYIDSIPSVNEKNSSENSRNASDQHSKGEQFIESQDLTQSLPSENKFIPMEVIDEYQEQKGQPITMSKLQNYEENMDNSSSQMFNQRGQLANPKVPSGNVSQNVQGNKAQNIQKGNSQNDQNYRQEEDEDDDNLAVSYDFPSELHSHNHKK